MNHIPPELKELLLKLRERFPEEKQQVAFSDAIRKRISCFDIPHSVTHTIIGLAIGALIDQIPLVGNITNWAAWGAVLGAWVGAAKDIEERNAREQTRVLIAESIREALAQ